MAAVIGHGKPTAALGESQAIRMVQALVLEFKFGRDFENDRIDRNTAIKSNRPQCQIACREVLVVRRHEGNAIRERKPRMWAANLEGRLWTEGFIFLVLFENDDRPRTLRYRQQFDVATC